MRGYAVDSVQHRTFKLHNLGLPGLLLHSLGLRSGLAGSLGSLVAFSRLTSMEASLSGQAITIWMRGGRSRMF